MQIPDDADKECCSLTFCRLVFKCFTLKKANRKQNRKLCLTHFNQTFFPSECGKLLDLISLIWLNITLLQKRSIMVMPHKFWWYDYEKKIIWIFFQIRGKSVIDHHVANDSEV